MYHLWQVKMKDFSLNKRQKARYERYSKQEEIVLQEHLAVVKQIEKEWSIFKEQNTKAFQDYNKSQETRVKKVNISSIIVRQPIELISDKIQEKGDRIAEESDQYKKRHKVIEAEKKEFYVRCVKEWKNRELGKGLYDTSSSDEDS